MGGLFYQEKLQEKMILKILFWKIDEGNALI